MRSTRSTDAGVSDGRGSLFAMMVCVVAEKCCFDEVAGDGEL